MSKVTVVDLQSGFPHTASGRNRDELTREIADHLGGGSQGDVRVIAGKSLDDAVRYFNAWAWKFNRVTQDITLVADDDDYLLNSNFRSPWTAMMVDSNDKTRGRVTWVPYNTWTLKHPDQSATSSVPMHYTALNTHETGLVLVDPTPGTNITWPTMRITYHRRIVLASANDAILNVPVEFEDAIFLEAVARFIKKRKTAAEAREDFVVARLARIELEHENRDYPDTPHGH